jgi:hypothetical protein
MSTMVWCAKSPLIVRETDEVVHDRLKEAARGVSPFAELTLLEGGQTVRVNPQHVSTFYSR